MSALAFATGMVLALLYVCGIVRDDMVLYGSMFFAGVGLICGTIEKHGRNRS